MFHRVPFLGPRLYEVYTLLFCIFVMRLFIYTNDTQLYVCITFSFSSLKKDKYCFMTFGSSLKRVHSSSFIRLSIRDTELTHKDLRKDSSRIH